MMDVPIQITMPLLNIQIELHRGRPTDHNYFNTVLTFKIHIALEFTHSYM